MINAIKFAIEEIEASDQYFDHTMLRWQSCCGTRRSRRASNGDVVITGMNQIRYWRRLAIRKEVEPLTYGLGNRFAHQYIKYSCPNVANMLHPLLCHKLLIT